MKTDHITARLPRTQRRLKKLTMTRRRHPARWPVSCANILLIIDILHHLIYLYMYYTTTFPMSLVYVVYIKACSISIINSRGPKYHIDTGISHSGPKAQYAGIPDIMFLYDPCVYVVFWGPIHLDP